jgi:hypothetical protein
MRRLTQGTLVGMLLLMGVSLTTAQQVPQPVLRLGNFIEVGNDLFMHIYVSTDIALVGIDCERPSAWSKV